MISEHKPSPNVLKMIEVLQMIGVSAGKTSPAWAQKMMVRLFYTGRSRSPFEDQEMEEHYLYLYQLSKITDIRSVAGLADYLRQFQANAQRVIRQYSEGDVLTRLSMEQQHKVNFLSSMFRVVADSRNSATTPQ